jgi:hypothetical protein
MFKKITSIFVPILILILATSIPSQLAAFDCSDVLTLFARGSSQNPKNELQKEKMALNRNGKLTKLIIGEKFIHVNSEDFKIVEPEATIFFENVGTQIKSNYPNLSQEFISLHNFELKYNDFGYEAASAFGSVPFFVSRNAIDAKFGSNQLIDDLTYGDYRQSVKNGAEELSGFLADRINECPNQIIILGGFSQGAHVVGDALTRMHALGKEKELSRIGHVMLFGDPKFNGYKLETSRLNLARKYHSEQPWVRGAVDVRSTGSLGAREPYLPDIIAEKSGSWCDYQDVVCSGASGLVGGIKNFDVQAHGSVYKNVGGYIEEAAKEVYMKLQPRFAFLSGFSELERRSAIPVYRKAKQQLDVMFVFDITNDNEKALVPDYNYMYPNFKRLQDEYATAKVGIVSFTEQDVLKAGQYYTLPQSKIVHPLDEGVLDPYSVLTTQWANERFKKFSGGVDIEDSPFTPLNDAINQPWRDGARKFILYFTGSYGKTTEPYTNLQMQDIAVAAKQKGIEIIPVFTSKKFRSSNAFSAFVEPAKAWHQQFADQLGSGWVELESFLPEYAIYDIIMGRLRAPRVEGVSVGYGQDIARPFAVGEPLALSADANDPDSIIERYEWDLNGDKIFEKQTTSRQFVYEPIEPYTGNVIVQAVSADGAVAEQTIPIVIAEHSGNYPKSILTPVIEPTRTEDGLLMKWIPFVGTLILQDEAGMQVFFDGSKGAATLSEVPQGEFVFSYQAALDEGVRGDVKQIIVESLSRQQSTAIEQSSSVKDSTEANSVSGQETPIVFNNTEQPRESNATQESEELSSVDTNLLATESIENSDTLKQGSYNVLAATNNRLASSLEIDEGLFSVHIGIGWIGLAILVVIFFISRYLIMENKKK